MIAIIAILAAMLLPALSKARDKARTISCTSQLKQIANAMFMYTADSQDYYPPMFWNDGSNPVATYPLTYLNGGVISSSSRQWQWYFYTYIGDNKACVCPADTNRNVMSSYGAYTLYGGCLQGSTVTYNKAPKVGSLPNASQYIFGGDGNAGYWDLWSNYGRISKRHQGNNLSNFYFLDGHVESISRTKLFGTKVGDLLYTATEWKTDGNAAQVTDN